MSDLKLAFVTTPIILKFIYEIAVTVMQKKRVRGGETRSIVTGDTRGEIQSQQKESKAGAANTGNVS